MRWSERYRMHTPADERAGSASVVAVAMIGNALVAAAKTAAAVFTRSPSLLAEAVHSWVDTGNEVFVLVAERLAHKPADDERPLGYGRASFVWALFASIAMLMFGCVLTVWNGIAELRAPSSEETRFGVGYLILGIAFLLEGFSFLQTLRQMREKAARRGRRVFEHALRTSDSTLSAVFTEDFLALIALAIAALGMALHQLTGIAAFDAAGSIVIGGLLGAGALALIRKNARMLGGRALGAEQRAEALALLTALPEIARVTFLYAELIGPDRVLFAAAVALRGDHTPDDAARMLRRLEERIAEHEEVALAILTLASPEEADAVP
jgi:cation diffusion facilitator family transporter